MCGRYTTPTEDEILEYFDLELPEPWEQNHNASPTQHLPVIRMGGDGEYKLNFMYWTLLPKRFKSKKDWKFSTFNARGEELTQKPMYKSLLDQNRCIVPMSGFYEWPVDDAGKKRQMSIYHKQAKAFLVAGLWQEWAGGEGETDLTFSIVTCTANEFMKPLHNAGKNKHRMPVILGEAESDQWLSGKRDDAIEMIQPCPDEWMAAEEVVRSKSERLNQMGLF